MLHLLSSNYRRTLHYHWLEPVYYYSFDSIFPSTHCEKPGWWFGPADDIGYVSTYDILDAHTLKMIKRSVIRSATDPFQQNLCVNFPKLGGEEGDDDESDIAEIRSLAEVASPGIDPTLVKLPWFSPDELIGLSFLKELGDVQKVRAQVIRKIKDWDAQNYQNIKFFLKLDD